MLKQAVTVLWTVAAVAACSKEAPAPAPSPEPAVVAPETPPPAAPLPAAATPATALPVAATPAAAPKATATVLRAKGTHYAVTWTFAPPKVGELFAVDLTLTDLAGKPLAAPQVTVEATMPAHGHGMMTDPELKQVAPTLWHAEGWKLHMHGAWQFEVRVTSGGVKERLTAAYEQTPEATDGL